MFLKFSTLYKAIVLNLFGLALFSLATMLGYTKQIWDGDGSKIVAVIFGLLVYSLYKSITVLYEISNIHALIKAGKKVVGITDQPRERVYLTIYNKYAYLRTITNIMVTLGLIGTVFGLILTFSGMTHQLVSDVGQVSELILLITNGMGIALNVTLVGALSNIWLNSNISFLSTATNELMIELTK